MEQNGMACLVIGSDLFLFFGNNLASLLCSDANFNKGMLDVLLHNIAATVSGSHDRRLVQKVFQVCTCKSGCGLSDLSQIHILAKRLILGMNPKDLLTSLHIRTSDCHLTVKTSRTEDRRIQNIHTVCGSHYNNSLINAKSVHFHKKLVQGLLALIMTTAHTGSTLSCNSINLVNKDNTGRMAFSFFKQIPHTGSTHTYKHLHKI